VTWDDVGFYNGHTSPTDSFQMQLIGLDNGDFDIVFRYDSINWTTGDVSTGHPARVGFTAGDGNPLHYFELPGSGDQNSMLGLPNTNGDTGIPGVFIYQVHSGAPNDASTASGTVSFTDADTTDTHTASFTSHGNGYEGTFSLDPLSESNGTGSVIWHFALTPTQVNGIAVGSPLVQTYDVKINDGHGGVATQTVSVMVGGSGNDTITADQNTDLMIGNGGADTFVFKAHPGEQTIVDFTPGTDHIDLQQVVGVDQSNLATWLTTHAAQLGNDVVIDLDQTPHGTNTDANTVLLKNLVLGNLHSSDFIVHPGSAGTQGMA
jgi:VCBS repeat-containing protein